MWHIQAPLLTMSSQDCVYCRCPLKSENLREQALTGESEAKKEEEQFWLMSLDLGDKEPSLPRQCPYASFVTFTIITVKNNLRKITGGKC